MSKKVYMAIGIIVIILLAGGAIFFFSKQSTPAVSCAHSTPQPSVAAFGDSLVRGYGAQTDGGFVTMLSQKVGLPIANFGKDGNTTAAALERMDSVVVTHPSIVLVLLGGNDALQKVPQADTEKNLRTIITRFQADGSKVLLLGIIGGFPFSDPYASMFSSLAKEYKTDYIPNVLSGIIGHTDFMSDTVHPNEAGYRKIAERVYPILEKVCQPNE